MCRLSECVLLPLAALAVAEAQVSRGSGKHANNEDVDSRAGWDELFERSHRASSFQHVAVDNTALGKSRVTAPAVERLGPVRLQARLQPLSRSHVSLKRTGGAGNRVPPKQLKPDFLGRGLRLPRTLPAVSRQCWDRGRDPAFSRHCRDTAGVSAGSSPPGKSGFNLSWGRSLTQEGALARLMLSSASTHPHVRGARGGALLVVRGDRR